MPKIAPQHWRKLVAVFEAVGFAQTRTSGDHVITHKTGHPQRIVIPKRASVPVFVIRSNIRAAGITHERYVELLRRV